MQSQASGVLVIWNDIDESAEADFLAWHVLEHMPERVGLPGFLRGQRYAVIQGNPKYFNFYEAVSAETFSSPKYRERLNDPTPWTREVVAHFRNTGRIICKRVATVGTGDGAFVETIRLGATGEAEFEKVMSGELLPAIIEQEGIVAAHLLQGMRETSAGASAEKALRSGSDRIADWVLLIEAVDPGCLLGADHMARVDDLCRGNGAKPGWERGVYGLQFGLTQQDALAGKGGPRKWSQTNRRTT